MASNLGRIHEIEDVVKKEKITKQDLKRWAAYTVLSSTALVSAYNFGQLTIKPNLENEFDILKGASSYLRSYDDNDPTKALIYTKFSLEQVEKNQHMQGIKGLEDEVVKVENDIRTSNNKLVFKPVLDYIASRMDDLSKYNEDNGKSTKYFIFGYLGALATGGFGAAFYFYNWLKK